ncbi:multicopper oxidase domain-containing protein [Desulfatiglans anilini]|uniref:multicopper oxidase domain-containing protein n=1 Tax=Desulfatiglans anilini TaxID=90728 RepID=UPI00041367C6
MLGLRNLEKCGDFFRVVNPRLTPGEWIQKDTVLVNPKSQVEIGFMADNPGHWFQHCHNL